MNESKNKQKFLDSVSYPRGHLEGGKEKTFTFLLAAGLMIVLLMVVAVFAIVIVNGIPYYWPKKILEITMKDGAGTIIGEQYGRKLQHNSEEYQVRVKQGNRKLYGRDFVWIPEDKIESVETPGDLLIVERYEWGNAYGRLDGMTYKEFKKSVREMKKTRKKLKRFEHQKLVRVVEKLDRIKHKQELAMERMQTDKAESYQPEIDELENLYNTNNTEYVEMMTEARKAMVNLLAADDEPNDFMLYSVVSVYNPNEMNFFQKIGLFIYRFFEFIFAQPRESNTEGGVFPALFGTIVMVFLMSIFVFPLGVITAIFLNEYAKEGPLVRIIRIFIFNLAGVPSIVYGVFGLGFFVYGVGGVLDNTFFAQYLPNPTFGSGGVLWASLTLAILTLPVVVVASVEGLKSVPRGYREGAFALSATKWETMRDVVIPNAMPGMLTGLILAISRAAGEVAPLMLTGVVKAAPALPLDGQFPFFHLERKFMHLGFHIYDVGFQSPNIEAARPMVFNTTMLLLVVVFILNLGAIIIRNKMRKKLTRSGV
jgi:phosphate transport system permease protein